MIRKRFSIVRRAKRLLLNRYSLAFLYLRGEGIEIGALHNPLKVAPWAKVRYVDRMSVADLRRQYVELKNEKLVNVDIIDDGETLGKIDDSTQDFVIANHFIEHCRNPLLALENALRVLRPGSLLYLALPDKSYTFDRGRDVTSLAHLERDHREGPEWSRRGHFEEWVRAVNGVTDPERISREADHLMLMDYSIHYHVWTQREMVEMVQHLGKVVDLDIEVMVRHKDEVIFLIRKGSDGRD